MRVALLALLAALAFAPEAVGAPSETLPSRCAMAGKGAIHCGVQRIDAALATALTAKKGTWSIDIEFESDTTNADLATISAIPWVTRVRVSSKLVTDLAPLSGLASLSNLGLFTPGVKSLAPLGTLTKLRNVDVFGAWIADVSPLAASKGLEHFSTNMPLLDLAPLAGLTSVRELMVGDLKDWNVLKGMTSLESLSAFKPTFKDLGFLSNPSRLRSVGVIKGASLASIDALKGATELRELHVGGSQVADISVVAGMPKLQVLTLHDTPVTSIAPVSKITTLERVDLSGTKVHDLTPLLASAKNLQQLLAPADTPDSALEPFRKANPKIWFHDTY